MAFVVTAAAGALLERTLYRPMYGKPHLDQVLFSIGLAFMAVASVDYFVGSSPQTVQLPDVAARALRDRQRRAGNSAWVPTACSSSSVCVALALGLQAILSRTRFGSRLRAAVDDPRVAAGLGIPVNRVFLVTFAVGSGLAGLGGALGADILGLDPTFPLKFMVYFLIVCAVGGTSSITGPLVAALVLGIADVMGKYYAPKLGAFVVYVLMIAILLWRPQGLFTRREWPMNALGSASTAARLLAPSRWRAWEVALWLAILATPFVLGAHAPLINEIAIFALFALSLDLILGYAGIVSLGHAAYFGAGAYGAALFAKHVMPDPLVGLAVGTAAGALLGLVTSPMIVRGTDLTRLMVTMGVALVLLELANKFDNITGGVDGLQGVVIGPLLGRFEFDLGARRGLVLLAGGVVHRLPAAAPHRALAARRVAAGAARQPAAPDGGRPVGAGAAGRGVHAGRRAGRCGRRAADADHRLRLARRAGVSPQRRRDAGAGDRRRRLAVGRRWSARSRSR